MLSVSPSVALNYYLLDSGVCEREDMTMHAAEEFLCEVCVCDTDGSLLVTLNKCVTSLLTERCTKKHVGTKSECKK